MLNPSGAGIKATREITEKLATELYIKVIGLESEPDELSEKKIREMLGA